MCQTFYLFTFVIMFSTIYDNIFFFFFFSEYLLLLLFFSKKYEWIVFSVNLLFLLALICTWIFFSKVSSRFFFFIHSFFYSSLKLCEEFSLSDEVSWQTVGRQTEFHLQFYRFKFYTFGVNFTKVGHPILETTCIMRWWFMNRS